MVIKADIIVFGKIITKRRFKLYRVCQVCGKIFLVAQKNRKYCGRACYHQAKEYLRKKKMDMFIPFEEFESLASVKLGLSNSASRKTLRV
jgi:ribosomal protein S27AE